MGDNLLTESIIMYQCYTIIFLNFKLILFCHCTCVYHLNFLLSLENAFWENYVVETW